MSTENKDNSGANQSENIYDKIRREAREKQEAKSKEIPIEERLKTGGLQR
jgi:hypothetical protein